MANSREIRWLHRELPRWVEQGLVSSDSADRLREVYAVPDTSRLVFVLLGVLGSAMIGGGIVLLIAHNWEDLSRFDRALLCLGLLVSAQLVAGYTAFKRADVAAWREAAVLFVALTIAAAIALIGQTYHLPGDTRAFLSTCMLLTLPLVYLFDSRAGAGLYLVALWFWPITDFMNPGDRFSYLVHFALVVPYLLSLRRARDHSALVASLGGISVIALCIVVTTIVSDIAPTITAMVLSALAASLYAAGSDEQVRDEIPGYAPAARNFGSAGIAVAIAILCVVDGWDFFTESHTNHLNTADDITYGVVAFLLAAVWVWRALHLKGPWHRRLATALPIAVGVGIACQSLLASPTVSVLLLSAYGLILGIGALTTGVAVGSIRSANAGLTLIVVVLGIRFADAEWSFVARGIGFIVLGIAFLALNTRLLRSRRGATS